MVSELFAAPPAARPFAQGTKPVIRWIKGDGQDDPVTRAAIAQATRLFGDSVDYCLCTAGLPAQRVRHILSWAAQPVDWMPVGPRDNAALASRLMAAGCPPDRFGYWWKWFPERVRPDAPEWILDGDMVVTAAPDWFAAWLGGTDPLRVSQDDRWPAEGMYGAYVDQVDLGRRLYSGLISLPPGLRYMDEICTVLARQPLAPGHDGCVHMDEQGVVAAAFGNLAPEIIPLSEFPFGRAFEDHIDYGLRGPAEKVWGYHFGHAFRRENPHFVRLASEGVIFSAPELPVEQRFAWLRNYGPWGRPGWSMNPECAARIGALAARHAGRAGLEIGTSRGHLSAILACRGLLLTTIDREDRGAAQNLDGLGVEIVRNDALAHLQGETRVFDFIVVDLHGNDEATWRALWPVLKPRLAAGGTMVLYNSHLWKSDEFRGETGLRWIAENALGDFVVETQEEPPPGMLVCHHA